MAIDKFNSINEIQMPIVSKIKSSESRADGFSPLNLTQNGDITNTFNTLIKNSPLDDRIPTAKSLARLGFKLDPNASGLGDYYYDDKGNEVHVSNYLNMTTGESFYNVTYKDKNVNQLIVFDLEGNPMHGEISRITPDQSSIETFKYDYDIKGNPFITNYNTRPYYMH